MSRPLAIGDRVRRADMQAHWPSWLGDWGILDGTLWEGFVCEIHDVWGTDTEYTVCNVWPPPASLGDRSEGFLAEYLVHSAPPLPEGLGGDPDPRYSTRPNDAPSLQENRPMSKLCMTVVPMVNAYLPFPEVFHHRMVITDDLPADALGEGLCEALMLGRSHPAQYALEDVQWMVVFRPMRDGESCEPDPEHRFEDDGGPPPKESDA